MPNLLPAFGTGSEENELVSDFPDTRDSLLVRVKNSQDRDAWDQFVAIYRPTVYRIARARGLQDADAQDLAQQVMLKVAGSIPDWQRTDLNTRFRHWLRRVAKNAVINALTRQPKDRASGGTDAGRMLDTHPKQDAETSDEIELEYRRQLFRRAAEIVRGRADEVTWLAFALTMIDGESIPAAAAQLQRTEGTIYAARSRIMRRLRDVIRELEDE